MNASNTLTRKTRFRRTLWAALVLATALLPIRPAFAAPDYIVELVLFEHRGAQAPGGGGLYYPTPRTAVTLGSEQAAALGIVPDDQPLTLEEDARLMTASGRYRVLQHFRWRQPGLAAADAIRLRVALGNAVELYVPESAEGFGDFMPAALAPRPDRPRAVRSATVNGTLRLRLGRFLHLESRLVYTDAESGRSYRLNESRKMRSRELHYIDNPRFGILTRIVPVEEDAQTTGDAPLDDEAPSDVQN